MILNVWLNFRIFRYSFHLRCISYCCSLGFRNMPETKDQMKKECPLDIQITFLFGERIIWLAHSFLHFNQLSTLFQCAYAYALLNYWIKITENTFPINLTQSINLQLDAACSFNITVPQYEQFIKLNSNWQLRLKIEKRIHSVSLSIMVVICIVVAALHSRSIQTKSWSTRLV